MVPLDLIGTLKALKWPNIRFLSSAMVLSNLANFQVAVGVTVMAVGVIYKDGLQRKWYFYCIVANGQDFQIYVP